MYCLFCRELVDNTMEQSVPWQQDKKVLERNCYMLENEIATDVCFEFSSPEGATALVRAHKIFLIGASPYFEKMFLGNMEESLPECGNIKIEDIDAAVFKELLRLSYSL